MDTLLVVTSLPDRESAEKLAVLLIERRLAACVNILAPCASVYRWQGEIQHDEEHPLVIKTVQNRYTELEASIRANHPYELPEIIAVSLVHGLPDYLQWVESETRDNDQRP
jgi:periplasmic divalent cation tolerance protein